MYLGRKQQGQEVVLPCPVTNGAGTPTAPDSLPNVAVYTGGVRLFRKAMPPVDRYRVTALFEYRLRLGSSCPPGHYQVAYTYTIGGQGFVKADNFEVVAGGHPAGALLSMYYLQRPHGQYLVQRTDAGAMFFRRGPFLS